MTTTTTSPDLSPIERSVRVPLPPARAFSLFTTRMASWWPLRGDHSIFGDALQGLVFEERLGGRVFERSTDGREGVWGTVTAWDPPSGFTMTWHPGRGPETAQTLELRFSADGDGSRVTLVHKNWHVLGDEAAATREGYSKGWVFVFDGCFGDAARG